jgi:hypothetical protein
MDTESTGAPSITTSVLLVKDVAGQYENENCFERDL